MLPRTNNSGRGSSAVQGRRTSRRLTQCLTKGLGIHVFYWKMTELTLGGFCILAGMTTWCPCCYPGFLLLLKGVSLLQRSQYWWSRVNNLHAQKLERVFLSVPGHACANTEPAGITPQQAPYTACPVIGALLSPLLRDP